MAEDPVEDPVGATRSPPTSGILGRLLRPADLGPRPGFPRPDPRGTSRAAWLEEVFLYADARGVEAATWYQRKTGRKRLGGVVLRFVAIVLVALAGCWPVLVGLLQDSALDEAGFLPPELATLFLAAAGFSVLADRLLGWTSGWMRFVQANQEIDRLVERFRTDWSVVRSGWLGREPDDAQVQAALALVQAFQAQVHGVVARETKQWVEEFKQVLKAIDQRVEERPPPESACAIRLKLLDHDRVDGNWSWKLDTGVPRVATGPQDVLAGLVPGLHTITVRGRIWRTERTLAEAERSEVVNLSPGQDATVELSLG